MKYSSEHTIVPGIHWLLQYLAKRRSRSTAPGNTGIALCVGSVFIIRNKKVKETIKK